MHCIPEGKTETRLDQIGVELPPIDSAWQYMIQIALDIGVGVLDYVNINAYMQSTGIKLDSWSVMTLNKAGRWYSNSLYCSRSPASIAPFIDRSNVANKLKKIAGALND